MTIEVQFLVSAFLLPTIGLFIDKKGRFIHVMMVGGFVNLGTHLMMLLLPDCEDGCIIGVLPYMIYGISFSVYVVAMWGAIPYLINEKKSLGTAYGILACLQNLGTTLMPLLIGFIHDQTVDRDFGFFYVEMAFIVFSIISILLKLMLY